MYLKKRKAGLLLAVLLIIIFATIIYVGKGVSRESTQYLFYNQNTLPVIEHTLPLPVPSEISTEHGNLRLDLEKVSVNKYYIIYSLIYGDQSNTTYHLFLTDLSKTRLDPEEVSDIWLEKTDGTKILPSAELPVITGFPQDDPLGWKINIKVVFPYQPTRSNHNLYLKYKDKIFKLKNISY